MMRLLDHTDARGLVTRYELPEEAEDTEILQGIRVGPPDLSPLELPPEIELRLNAELWRRGIITLQDAQRKRGELLAAWQSVLKVDVNRLMALYVGEGGYH